MTNAHEHFVVLGLEDVERATEVARARGWSIRRAPDAIRRSLRVRRHCRLLRRPGTRVDVVITAAPLPCRAAGWWTGEDSVALDHLGLTFRGVLRSCTSAEQLVTELVQPIPVSV